MCRYGSLININPFGLPKKLDNKKCPSLASCKNTHHIM